MGMSADRQAGGAPGPAGADAERVVGRIAEAATLAEREAEGRRSHEVLVCPSLCESPKGGHTAAQAGTCKHVPSLRKANSDHFGKMSSILGRTTHFARKYWRPAEWIGRNMIY
jgi:hypothetical protein